MSFEQLPHELASKIFGCLEEKEHVRLKQLNTKFRDATQFEGQCSRYEKTLVPILDAFIDGKGPVYTMEDLKKSERVFVHKYIRMKSKHKTKTMYWQRSCDVCGIVPDKEPVYIGCGCWDLCMNSWRCSCGYQSDFFPYDEPFFPTVFDVKLIRRYKCDKCNTYAVDPTSIPVFGQESYTCQCYWIERENELIRRMAI